MSSTWTPIYSYPTDDTQLRTIGLDVSGEFVIKSPTLLTTLKEFRDYIALLPVLETDKALFEQALQAKHIEEEKISKLKSELYKCGLIVSPYWSELVINWIDTPEINEELRHLLTSTLSNTRISQSSRHRVRKMLRG